MIRSTFAGFTTAQLVCLPVSALDVTSQNIANINTRGYSNSVWRSAV